MPNSTPEGSADGPDVAALAVELCNADLSMWHHDQSDDHPCTHCQHTARLVLPILADRLAAVTAQRDQYAAQIARVEALADGLEAEAAAIEWAAPDTEVETIITAVKERRAAANRLRAALRADGGDSQ